MDDYRIMKRWIDIIIGLIMIILFSPLIVIVSILIKLTSRGPIFYKQVRLGEDGKPFVFLKFRSMYNNVDHTPHKKYVENYINGNHKHGGIYKLKDDPRITPFGRILRKTSIDELPQVINVLRGEMSMVGPRPPIPYEYEIRKDIQKKRLLVKPGITGVWQIRGRSTVPFDEMVNMDLEYIKKASLILDILIMFETFFAIVTGRGAY